MGLERITKLLNKKYSKISKFIKNEKSYLISSSVYLTTLIGDAITTNIGTSMYGSEVETNYITRSLIENFGNSGGLVMKFIPTAALVLGSAYYLNKKFDYNLGNKTLWFFSVVTTAAVIDHIYVLSKYCNL